MRVYTILIAALLLVPVEAHAYSAGDLLRDCKVRLATDDHAAEKDPPTLTEATAIGSCTAFIDATAQALRRLSVRLPVGWRVCLPQNYTVPAAIGHYVAFMGNKPESLARPAIDMAMASLAAAYPCH